MAPETFSSKKSIAGGVHCNGDDSADPDPESGAERDPAQVAAERESPRRGWWLRIDLLLRSNGLFWILLTLAVGYSLAVTLPAAVQSVETVRAELRLGEDVSKLYAAAGEADWSNAPLWWAGPWNYPGVRYFRPVTSMLFLAERRLFGEDFTRYNQVTCVMHSVNVALLFLLAGALLRNHPRARWPVAFLAASLFTNIRNTLSMGVWRAIEWWPAQNDVLSLTFGLLCLVLLERYLRPCGPNGIPSRRVLAGSMISLSLAICTKEMGFIAAPMALLLVWQRRGGWRVAAGFAVLAAWWWAYRRIVVPDPWEPEMIRAVILGKAGLHMTGPIYFLIRSQNYEILAAAAAVLAMATFGIRKRWSSIWVAAACLASAILAIQLTAEAGWALILVDQTNIRVMEVFAYLVMVILAVHYRRKEPPLLIMGWLMLAHLPILQYGGRHYFYWPAAFLGLLNAAAVVTFVRWAMELRADLRPRGRL